MNVLRLSEDIEEAMELVYRLAMLREDI